MKVLILAGGLGTRISEETSDKPKPMVLLDDKPILWHLMDTFSRQGFNDFVIAAGYRSEVIKRYFVDLAQLGGDISINFRDKSLQKQDLNCQESPWNVTILDTGINSQTGGRIGKIMQMYPGERFLATYGDGLANVSISKLIELHETLGLKATVTAVRPPARFGVIHAEGNLVESFGEKSQTDAGWVNGGYFVLEPEIVSYIKDDSTVFELEPMQRLVQEGQLAVHKHQGFWQPMDTLRERNVLAKLAMESVPPWLT